MITITQRELIRETPNRWRQQYGPNTKRDHWYDDQKLEVWERLVALGVKTASAEEVNAVIGNGSWTTMRCDECKANVKLLVRVGEEPDYESATARICLMCARAALVALDTALEEGAP